MPSFGAANNNPIYTRILDTLSQRKIFGLHIDPDKYGTRELAKTAAAAGEKGADLILAGGSMVNTPMDQSIRIIRENCDIPVLIFPGNVLQVSTAADAILLLCLISGRNPEYLIGNHVVAAPLIRQYGLEVIPTGYILIENGRMTSVEYVSNTKPIPADKTDLAAATAMAGEMLGHKLIYLEAGSGALNHVDSSLITRVKENIQIPLAVGGGIESTNQARKILDAGADIIIVGTAVEKNPDLIDEFCAIVRNQ